MAEQEFFLERIKDRTRRYFNDFINFCDSLGDYKSSNINSYLLVKSTSSSDVNYRQHINQILKR